MKRSLSPPACRETWGIGLCFFLGMVVLFGCGTDGLQRFDVAGEVTFDGQPVPAGEITFEPDHTQGNEGPQGFALIRNGRYNTAEGGRGVIGGPHLLRLTGWARIPDPGDYDTQIPELFPEYETTADLVADSPTCDIEVPASAAAGRSRGR